MGDLDSDADADTRQRQRARRKAAELALKQPNPHDDLAQRLDQLGLRPANNEPR